MWSMPEIRERVSSGDLTIRWDLTPEKALGGQFVIRSPGDLERYKAAHISRMGHYFYIDVWDWRARVFLMEVGENTASVVGFVDEIPEELAAQAVEEVGRAINMSGHYPVNEKVRKWLESALAP